MRFLFLNQSFHPDVAASGQYLSDLADALVQRGHDVTVLTARRACDAPRTLFPRTESWRGVRILRADSTGFGKTASWARLVDAATLLAALSLRGSFCKRPDLVVALTSPPLVGAIGWFLARLHRAPLVYWILDLNPDQAIAAGWLHPETLCARFLEQLSCRVLRAARTIIVLDRFMQNRVAAKAIDHTAISVLPPWADYPAVRFDPRGRASFRAAHALTGKFVVMYSGNHSPCHPLATVLEAARLLAACPDFIFCFIGGGSEFRKLQAGALSGSGFPRRDNLLFLPYQARTELSASLSAADAHLVVMGEPFVGIIHPSKIYNLLAVGAPILYVGPTPSPTSEALRRFGNPRTCACVQHGDAPALAAHLERIKTLALPRPANFFPPSLEYSRDTLLPALVRQLERAARDKPTTASIGAHAIALDDHPCHRSEPN